MYQTRYSSCYRLVSQYAVKLTNKYLLILEILPPHYFYRTVGTCY